MNTKQDCIEHLAYRIPITADWREGLADKYPSDGGRNRAAAVALRKVADDADHMSDLTWAKLQPFYNETSQRWMDAVSVTSRDVWFKRKTVDFDGYLAALITNLSSTVH